MLAGMQDRTEQTERQNSEWYFLLYTERLLQHITFFNFHFFEVF